MKRNRYGFGDVIKVNWRYLLVAVMPFAWYIAFKNHSYSHGSFTFRCLFITVYAGMNALLNYGGNKAVEYNNKG